MKQKIGRKAGVFLAVFCLAFCANGQSILKLKKPLIYYTSTYNIAAVGGGYIYSTKVRGLSRDEITALSINNLSSFNQKAVANYSGTAKQWSDVSLFTTAALPTMLSLHKGVRKEFFTYNTVYAQALASTMGQIFLIKSITKKNRPWVYNPAISIEEKQQAEARFSFPSGHIALAATASYFFATTYSLYFPKSKYKGVVWAGAALLPIITGYLRYAAGKHFVSDLATGYAIGAANGIVFPLLFRVGK